VEVGLLALAGSATAFATGLGTVPVFLLGERADRLRTFLWGITVGLMTVASIVGLLAPALDAGNPATVGAGLGVGVLFLLGSRRLLSHRDVHVGELRGAGVRRALLVFGVLLVHSLPEGFAIVEQISGLLPFSFAFAAGAMLALVVAELVPQAFRRGGRVDAIGGTALGGALMLGLAAALGVDA
jgi:zinc transporter ZupT